MCNPTDPMRAARHVLPFLLTVMLAAPAGAAVREIPLTETWRIDGDDELLLGEVRDALIDVDGFVYLLDEQLAQISVISPGGELDRVIGREGEGPGEFQWPGDLLWLPGPELGVLDNRRGEISLLSPDGTPTGSWLMRGEDGLPLRSASMAEAKSRGGSMALVFGESINRKGEFKNAFTLAIVAEDGEVVKRVISSPRGWDFARREFVEKDEYLAGRGWWTIGPEGRLYVAPERNSYYVEILSAAGERELAFGRDEFRPRLRSAEEKREMADRRSMFINGEKVKIACEIEDSDPAIRDIHVDEDGTIRVRATTTSEENREEIAFDLYDGEGNFRERIRYTGFPLRPVDRLFVLAPGRFVLLRAAFDLDGTEEPFAVMLLEAN